MSYDNAVKVAAIVRDAGGRIVGRTRLQKITYLLSVAGLESGLPFAYKHYGPYSEELAVATLKAGLLGLLNEREDIASWGGTYSTYTVAGQFDENDQSPRRRLIAEAVQADAVELELAATALYLARDGVLAPWAETARRKPEKAENGRLERAKELYHRLTAIETPNGWPSIA